MVLVRYYGTSLKFIDKMNFWESDPVEVTVS